jgi:formylglycine-generating enzyme required for sulfatase activity/serine/threonine protein kinase
MSDLIDQLHLCGETIAEKYVVESVVANGGFSAVYRAQHQIWREPVAIKCFTALGFAQPETRGALLESFVREGKVMSQLSSQTAAVVQARDIGSLTLADGRWIPYMVLEWLDGVTLSYTLDSELALGQPARTLREALLALEGPMHALALAHALGIAHLDIKPDNIFVCGDALRDGVPVKILDFGVAKVLDRRHAGTGEYVGKVVSTASPDYAAPEQYDPSFGPTGPATDVFSMALVILEIMRGGVPVLAEGLALDEEGFRLMRERSTNRVRRPTPRALGLEVSDAVESVFQKALSVNVRDRHVDLGTFANEVRVACALPAFVVRPNLNPEAMARQARASTRPRAARIEVGAGTAFAQPDDFSSPDVTEVSQRRSGWIPWAAAGLGLVGIGAALIWLTSAPSNADESNVVAAGLAPVSSSGASENQGQAPGQLALHSDQTAQPACPADMVLIPGGKFFMGSDAEEEPVLAYSRPSHQIELAPYCLDVHEVTVGEYRACSRKGECKRAFLDSYWEKSESMSRREWTRSMKVHSELCNENYDDRDDHPINCVAWQQALDFCQALGKTLPSEAQWEFAARGSDGRIFPWGDEDPDFERMNGCGLECEKWRAQHRLSATPLLYQHDDGFAGTAPVGSFAKGKTQHGVHDIIGNVFEWTLDRFLPYPDAPASSVEMFPKSEQHTIRGGAFNSVMATFANPALRFGLEAQAHSHGVGFRCARAAEGGASLKRAEKD